MAAFYRCYSELIRAGNAEITRCAVDDRTFHVGIVGFVEQVIDVPCNEKFFVTGSG